MLLTLLVLAQVETVARELANPFGVVRGPDGLIYFCEVDSHLVRRIEKDGALTTIAGRGTKGYVDGPAREAAFDQPHEIRFDARGDLYVADMRNHAVRKIDLKRGAVSTVVGGKGPGYEGDGGPAAAARLKQPHSIQFGPDGALYICDIGNHVIRLVDAKGLITTFAGTGKPGLTPDGAPLRGTPLNGPRSLDVDKEGRLWLATREGNQVFTLDPRKGVIRHVAGSGKKGFGGHGGPAREAPLSGPKGIALAPDGDVLLVDTESHSIRKIDVQRGTLELLIGTGEKGDGPDGPATSCRLARPHGIWIDPDGSVYVGDSENHRLRRLRP